MQELLNDWAGWLFIFFSFFIVTVFREIRKDGRIVLALWLVLALHHVVALTNAYIGTVKGAESDAATFHRLGAELAVSGDWSLKIGSGFYEQFLGVFYKILSPSHLLGEELSILAFALSCVVLLKLINLLGLRQYRVGILLLFGLLPAMLLLGSVTLREPYQILFFMLSVYWGLRFYLKPARGAMVFCVLSSLAMGLFHKGLILYVLFLLPLVFLWPTQPVKRAWGVLKFSKRRLIGGVVALLLVLGLFSLCGSGGMPGLEALKSVASGRGLEYVEKYRASSAAIDARATYGMTLDTSSPGVMAVTMLLVYIYYLFSPFPWQVSNILDFYAAIESMLRFVLIVFAIVGWRGTNGVYRRTFGLLLVIYFSMAFLWSLGTTNYGTSIRHHLVNFWIIVVLGGPGLIAFIARLIKVIVPGEVSGTSNPRGAA